jgi:hypothetical protein
LEVQHLRRGFSEKEVENGGFLSEDYADERRLEKTKTVSLNIKPAVKVYGKVLRKGQVLAGESGGALALGGGDFGGGLRARSFLFGCHGQ